MEEDMDKGSWREDSGEPAGSGSVVTAVHFFDEERLWLELDVVLDFAVMASKLGKGLVLLLNTKQT